MTTYQQNCLDDIKKQQEFLQKTLGDIALNAPRVRGSYLVSADHFENIKLNVSIIGHNLFFINGENYTTGTFSKESVDSPLNIPILKVGDIIIATKVCCFKQDENTEVGKEYVVKWVNKKNRFEFAIQVGAWNFAVIEVNDFNSFFRLKTEADNQDGINKPPTGLKPLWLSKEHRLIEIREAIERYNQAKKSVPQEWIDELQDTEEWIQNWRESKK